MGASQFDQGLFYQQWRTSKAFCVLDDPCVVICARVSYTHECHDWIQWYVLALPRPQWPPQPKVTNYGSVPATSQPYIQTPDGSQVHWSSFRLVNYIIHDGWRVGLTGDYIVKAVSRDELCMVASIPLHPLLSSFHLFHDTDRLPSRSFELLGLELLHQWRSRVLYIFTTTCISGTHPEMPADVGSHPV